MKRRAESGGSLFRIDLKKNDFRRLAKTLCGAAVILGGSALLSQSETKAQSLDQAIQAAIAADSLGQNCAAFNFTSPPANPSPSEAGPTLRFLCDTPSPTANQASAGGGAALSSSTSGSPVIERRLRRLEEESDDKKTTSIQGASPDTVIKLTDKLSIFASFEYELLDKDRTSNEDGFDSDNFSVTGGGDYRISNAVLVGTAFSYIRQDGDFDGGGNFTNDTYGGLVFANFIPAPGFFIDTVLGGSYKDYENSRTVNFSESSPAGPPIRAVSGSASSDTSGYSIEGAVKGGYDFNFGRYTVGPRVGLNIVHTEIDGYTENGDSGLELRIDNQDVTSVQSTLGVLATAAISTKLAVIVPQVGLDYIHEFDNDQRNINFSFVQDLRATPATFTYQNQAPDRDFLNLHGGVSMVLPHGWTTFFNYRGLFAHSFFNSHAFGGGLRKEF